TGAGLVTHFALAGRQPDIKQNAADKPREEKVELPKAGADKKARTDRHGEPLPAGAVDRLGTGRLRHGAPVRSLGYSTDGKLLIAAGADWLIRFWDPASGKELRRLGNVTGPFLSGALSRDGKLLATASEDTIKRSLRLWNVATGKEITLPTVQRGNAAAVAF